VNYFIDLETENYAEIEQCMHQAWFVVYTKARQEQVALENLARQNFEAYCPNIAITKRRKGELISQIEPFFPRYIFLRFNLQTDNWAPVRSTRGVSGLVRFGGVPRQVPASLIRMLRQNEDPLHLQQIMPRTWMQGDVVEIEQGPFAGYSCIFQAERSVDRIAVLLNIVGKQTRVTLLKQDLQLPQFA